MKNANPKRGLSSTRITARIIVRTLLIISALSASALGCAWIGTSHSVRFNGYQTEREMGRLPPLPTLSNGMNELRVYWGMEDVGQEADDDYSIGERLTEAVNGLWERAEAAEKAGNLRLEQKLLHEYLARTNIARNVWFSPTNRQERRNSAFDRLDALSALDRHSTQARVQAYLNARRSYDSGDAISEEIRHYLEFAESDPNLKDNVAYLRAAQVYREKDFAGATKAFRAIARQHPNSEKREVSLFMAAVAMMKTSACYTPTSGDYTHLREDNGQDASTPAFVPPDRAWHDAFSGFTALMVEYPHGRYFNDARGWRAYLMLRNNDRASALVEYYRLLADKRDENARIEAAFSLTLVRHHATEDEMARVEANLESEPDSALAYAYHHIYNYSIDPGSAYPFYGEEIKSADGKRDYEAEWRRYEELQKDWQRKRALTGRKELARILSFSRRLMRHYPKLELGGAFALRAAQASLELGNNRDAAQFARRALQSRLGSRERCEALWTFGVAEHRLHHFISARKNLQVLLRDYPKSDLVAGARRILAMIAEDEGNVDGALEQYIALDYNLDVAYFVDVLMTPEQLADFIKRHPDSPKRNEFTYALGVRYLRANRWNEARKTFAWVRTTGNPDYNIYSSGSNCLTTSGYATSCMDPKQPNFDAEDKPIITSSLVMRDVQTAADLEGLERAASLAEGDEAKAEALYQLASYQYEASSLLFYNPVAWSGGRYWNLSQLAGKGNYRLPNEPQILWNYMQEHERLARALKIYLDVADRYPHTLAARDSLYTAAVCHERLADYNPYWRKIYETGLHAGQRMVTYTDVKAVYPHYQLPRGTYGWEPSTRTVNGRPGWAAPPKPAPRLSRQARLENLIGLVFHWLQSFWNETGRRWLNGLTILAVLLFTARVTSRKRKILQARLARLRQGQAKEMVIYPWMAMFWIDPVQVGWREKLRTFIKDRRKELLELTRDRKSRPILVENILLHSLLTGLLLSLVWVLHF